MLRKHPDVPLVIDFHTHMLDAELVRLCASKNAITGFGKKEPPTGRQLREVLCAGAPDRGDGCARHRHARDLHRAGVHVDLVGGCADRGATDAAHERHGRGLGAALSDALRRHRDAADAGRDAGDRGTAARGDRARRQGGDAADQCGRRLSRRPPVLAAVGGDPRRSTFRPSSIRKACAIPGTTSSRSGIRSASRSRRPRRWPRSSTRACSTRSRA